MIFFKYLFHFIKTLNINITLWKSSNDDEVAEALQKQAWRGWGRRMMIHGTVECRQTIYRGQRAEDGYFVYCSVMLVVLG